MATDGAPKSGRMAVPEHPDLPAEARQAYVEVERKLAVFIAPQLQQLGAGEAVERILSKGGALAERAAAGEHKDLATAYRDLLEEAQGELRQARAASLERDSQDRRQHHDELRLGGSLSAAKGILPPSRLARLRAQLDQLGGDGVGVAERVALVEAAMAEWEQLGQTRQAREAERLADQAHLPVRPRQLETSRSRRARRDQARIVELARAAAAQPMDGPAEERQVEEASSPAQ